MLKGYRNAVCNMDDILEWSKDREEHNKYRKVVLECIRDSGTTLKKDKCIFRTNNKIKSEKTTAFKDLPAPTTKNKLQSILGSVNFLARHVLDKLTLLLLLYDILKADREILRGKAQKSAFNRLKKLLRGSGGACSI